MIHDQLSALFQDTRPPPRFHTPAVSFDMSQRDLHDGVTLFRDALVGHVGVRLGGHDG